jgi:hypothetical protein
LGTDKHLDSCLLGKEFFQHYHGKQLNNSEMERAIINVIMDVKKEKEHWLNTAVYLASCHAATLEDEGKRKSISKSSKRRFYSIVEKALSFLEGKSSPVRHGVGLESELEWTKNRCRKAMEEDKV